MPDSRAFILTGDDGKPWRIPGSVSSLPALDDGLENSCGDPSCPGSSAHAPDQAIKFAPRDPIARLLVIPKGGH